MGMTRLETGHGHVYDYSPKLRATAAVAELACVLVHTAQAAYIYCAKRFIMH